MRKAILPALSAICSVFLLHCNENPATSPDSAGEAGEVKLAAQTAATAVQAAAVAATDRIFTDASGEVRMLVRTCDYEAVASSGKHCTYCALDQGWVMVGGGAEIEGSPSSARLRGSFPFPNSLTQPVRTPDGLESNCTGNTPNNSTTKDWIAWMARSDGASSHRLRAYVVGLQITGMTESNLAGHRLINDNTSTFLTQPSLESTGAQALVGGGANEVGSQNCYLTESRPNESTNAWRGSAYCAAPGGLKVYSIHFNTCLSVPGWDNGCMDVRYRSRTTGPVTGYGTSSLATPYPFVTSSIGGKGVVNFGSSRYLADLIPLVGTNHGFSVTTKDQGVSVNGTTTGYSVNLLGGRWGTWRFNSIRFNTAGSTLHRPSGVARVSLRQAFANPDAGPYRWNLESLGGGHYRIRNANPSRPASGECAYRQPGTSNVLVGACNTTNEYRWTADPGLNLGPFKLRNVSSGTCLDNNNSTVDSNLRLASCVAGYSTRQSLFLDTYSWLP